MAAAAWLASPAQAATPLQEVEALMQRGETAAAMRRADDALSQAPGDAGLRFLRGVLLGRSGRHAEAIDTYERLTQDFPELPEPYNNLAVLQAAQGRLDAARTLLETALRLDAGYRTALENLGDVLARQAERAYEAALASGRGDAGLQRKLRAARELRATADATPR